MKLFQGKTLQQAGVYILIALFVILFAEYLTIVYKIEDLEKVEERKDYARSIQLDGQEIAYLIQLHLNGHSNQSAIILSRLEHQEHMLKVLGDGGRIDESDLVLEPLPRLARITFDNLYDKWSEYKSDITTAFSKNAEVDTFTKDTALPAKWLTLSDWYERLMADLTEEAVEKKASTENLVLFFIITDILILVGLFYLAWRHIIIPLRKLRHQAVNLEQDQSYPHNEIGMLTEEINTIIEQLKDATDFVGAIGEGKLDFDYKTLDDGYTTGKNKLADSLIAMQGKLRMMNEEENRRQWANEGLTKFVDILRSSNDNIAILGDKIVSALVQYTRANQGGLYILNDDDERDKYLELISLFAFDIKKHEKQKIKLGEGILGQTFLEKETTVLNELPEEYIRITSGLGDANPRSILMVPLKVDTQVYGIVELASFNEFKPHEISFVERLAETIASTLSSVKAAQRNKTLIEQFHQQTEEMRAQEEEMRQNMEELQATQEEISRKENDYISKINTLQQELEASKSSDVLDAIKLEHSREKSQLLHTIHSLELSLSQKPEIKEAWAEALEQNLKVQLEALRITQDELNKKLG